MAQGVAAVREEDRAAVHHFIRTTGRAPTDEELADFRRRGTSGEGARRRPGRRTTGLRPRAARLLVRL